MKSEELNIGLNETRVSVLIWFSELFKYLTRRSIDVTGADLKLDKYFYLHIFDRINTIKKDGIEVQIKDEKTMLAYSEIPVEDLIFLSNDLDNYFVSIGVLPKF